MQLAEIERADSLLRLFLDRARERGDSPFLWSKEGGKWHSISWSKAVDTVERLAAALNDLGFSDGDRILLVSENRPEWCLADLAIMAAGCVTVPAYITNGEHDHLHVLDDSGAKAAIVSTAKLARQLLPAMFRCRNARTLIAMEPLNMAQSGTVDFHDWSALIAQTDLPVRSLEELSAGIARSDLACLIYTSGTGGAPRGVRQHHGALLHNVAGAAEIIVEDFGWDDEVFLSFLPLSHAYEHTGGFFLPVGLGAQIYFAESLDKLAANIEEVRPTIMVVVPRLFEMLRARMLKALAKEGGAAQRLLDIAISVGRRELDGKWRPWDTPVRFVLSRTLIPKVRQRFGGRMKAMVSGGAPLNPEVGRFFHSLGIPLLQGYGQTESAPIISCNRPAAGIRMESVGRPIRNTEVRIAEDGEILVRGELVMHGYWNDEDATRAALADGWLHTGDVGHLDEAGRIVITDRKKDIIVNDKGDNVSPQRVEGMLTLEPEIHQAMVSGDRRPYLVGLIVPGPEWASDWASERGLSDDPALLAENAEFRSAIASAIDRVNRSLTGPEKVRQFAFADEVFSIDNSEMTPSLKIRRHKIRERYQERIDRLYH